MDPMNLTIPLPFPLWEGEDEGAGGGDGDPPPDPAGDPPAPVDERPEWLPEKYKTPEEFAQGYKELTQRFTTKTEDLRKELSGELQEQISKEFLESRGVPEDLDGYEYPENWEAPEGEIDSALKEWAKENAVGKEAFQKLITEVWAKTMPDADAEFAKLGGPEEAQGKINAVNRFANKTFGEEDIPALKQIMQTADGVEFLNRLSVKMTGTGVFPEGGSEAPTTLTRASIREMQADPRYNNDPGFTKQVQDAWKRYTSMPPELRK